MEISHIIPHIEALIFASDRPLTPMDITELINNAFGFMEDKITLEQIMAGIDGIYEKYQAEFYPFELRESGGGWQFLTKKDFHKTVAQLNGEKFLKRLSSAALETLAIIAYKQPITKGDIESIRGVSCDYTIQKLLEKELIYITGRNEDLPGKPLVYATSKNFMDYFGLNSPDDLPKLKEIFDEAMVLPTSVQDNQPASEETDPEKNDGTEISPLVVSENGELIEAADSQEKRNSSVEGLKTDVEFQEKNSTTGEDQKDEMAEEITNEESVDAEVESQRAAPSEDNPDAGEVNNGETEAEIQNLKEESGEEESGKDTGNEEDHYGSDNEDDESNEEDNK